jgi:hypothetical protein
MRFPSLETVLVRSRDVVRRFPWTMLAGVIAAAAAVRATAGEGNEEWARIAMVASLGLPLTIALTLFAEERGWSSRRSALLNVGGIALLVLFGAVWPGPDRKHESIRYFQLSAGVHLLVATLPFVGVPETKAFWQFNRRLFQNILRAALFSMVLFVGLAIALGALDHLFGVDVPGQLYARLYLIIMFVVNTAIFLAEVPYGLGRLAEDRSYPRVLKVFAQYILTPIVFIYHVILLAYLVKIVAGGEWPSGWIGWLVTSVAVAGLLGFLLVHPLREHPDEGWIRGYTRWFFIGLIPAAIALLVAFSKRVLPYGLTELRFLGVLLGFWLLAISVSYSLRPKSGIRRIPVTLAALLLITLYGPLSVTALSVASQGRRLKNLIDRGGRSEPTAREASAALRFLLEHSAGSQIAAAIPTRLPAVQWDSVSDNRQQRDSMGRVILASVNLEYLPESARGGEKYFYFNADQRGPVSLSGYRWLLEVSSGGTAPVPIGEDSLQVRAQGTAMVRVIVGVDTFAFDLNRLARVLIADPRISANSVPPDLLAIDASGVRHRVRLLLLNLNGSRQGGSVEVRSWSGQLYVGPR